MSDETATLNLEDEVSKIFRTSVSGTGEEELLRIASTYSRQLSAQQIRIILYLEDLAYVFFNQGKLHTAQRIRNFVTRWLELKQFNNSDVFVMKALEFISLRKFINENTMKINIDK